ncbi:beta-lactamase family protein [Neolewinella aurantiaca]|uniref:Beta-lactamase family protein n=1 Tax=Neolewinella aurantiaca TaxID=2602767 RepID=A0A5C7FFN4_9BACT|nr:serine hydrolase domain-containing protein [Neolewinella aurantiaca]TXF89122.1 beta-lactamase family protein [Neolewinella aurantiaca]
MAKFLPIIILFFTLSSCCIITDCPDEDSPPSRLSDEIGNQAYVQILDNYLSGLPNNAQVAIGLVDDTHTEYIGVTRESDVLQTTDNADNVFEIGSITKVFTSICLSDMIASGEASLTETLQGQFDYDIPTGGDITFLQLANHTSGLPVVPTNEEEVPQFDPTDPYAVYTPENLQSYLQNHLVLSAASGTEYSYSNLGTGLLGYALAQKRNTTYEELVQRTVLSPLGMEQTTSVLENTDTTKLVEPRDQNGDIVPHWNFSEITTGAGSLKSSAEDMTRFIRKNFENDAVYDLPQETTFNRDDNFALGLGWTIFEEGEFSLLVHDGGTGGFSSILILDKNKRTGVILLANVADYTTVLTSLGNALFLEVNN